tara:strand:+ start:2841 stop:3989 length:1149 start_codon:yes stop_codon:yes gene_type:complete
MAVSAVLKIGAKVAAKSASILKGVTKSTVKNAKIKKRFRVAEKRYMRRRRLEKKRREQEALLEQQNTQKNTEGKKTKGSGKSPLERLISLVQALILGFVVNKLPKIIESVKKIISTIRDVFDKIKNFFNGIIGFFKSVGQIVGKVFGFIKSIDLSGISDNISNAFGSFNSSLSDMKSNFESGAREMSSVNNLEDKSGEKPNKLDTNNNSSVSDMQKTIDTKTENFKKSLKTIEKEATSFGDNERVQAFREDIKDIKDPFRNTVIQTLDGRELRRGDEGFEDELAKARQAMSNMNDSASNKTLSPAINNTSSQDNLNISNINKPNKVINTSTMVMDRKSSNTIMIVGNNSNQSQMTQQSNSGSTIVVTQKNDTLRDHQVLAVS